ncbi:hypothetical protein EV363DRAFT_1149687 [Boletus edulis]|nr:hypothetical protein EV363DRAFT_1149687 [Boletus edulis]
MTPTDQSTHSSDEAACPNLVDETMNAPGKPLPKEAEVVPKQSKIPSGHYEATHNNVSFIVPSASAPEPFYLVTKGKMVGVFSSWENMSSLVSRVSSATYRRLQPGVTISRAHQMMEKAIEDEVVTVIGQALVPPAVTL